MRSAKELFGTGGLETEGPLLLPDGSTTAAALVFSSKPADGFRWAAGSVMLRVAGSDVATWTPTGVTQGFGDGTAAVPSISFLNDTDTGFYRVGANVLGVATAGVGRFQVDAGGKVGIGVVPTTDILEIGGTGTGISLIGLTSNIVKFNTAGAGPPTVTTRSLGTKIVLFPELSASSTDYALGIEGNTLWMSVPLATGRFFKWYGGTTEIMRLRAEGELLIGTTTTPVGAVGNAVSLGETVGRKLLVYENGALIHTGLGVDLSGAGYEHSIYNPAGDTNQGRISFGNVSHANPGVYTEQLRLTTDGRLSGKSLHNNANPVTGTTDQYIASGTYTPALTNEANVAASAAKVCQFIRVGNVCTVSGAVDIDPTTTLTSTTLGLSVPIASNFTVTEQAGGTFATVDVVEHGVIRADVTNDRLQLNLFPTDVGNRAYHFTATYLIL